MDSKKLLEQLLKIRGIVDHEVFLSPKYENLYDPFLMHDMDKAVKRIKQAIQNNEKICVYSDYDADGIPGAVILHDYFKQNGYENFFNYIPHRHNEGYGLHKDALISIGERGAQLMITVDLGITAVDEVEYAKGLGMEIIITDHHEPLEKIPDAHAVVNPKLGDYPDPMLCGAGVAFKLVQALDTDGEWKKWLLDMAGLATLSDMVPLQNENRIIAYYGMKVLQKTKRPGLRALFQKAGISLNHLTEDDITFSITPRLNAAGRMAHPEDAFKTLATSNVREGIVAAEYLSKLNDDRKTTVARIMKDVHKKIRSREAENKLSNILVIGDPLWPAGILGLIASKITEAYNITTFVWGSEGDTIKGSCRGIGDVAIVEMMQKVPYLFVQFGGHDDAGGFTATRETIHFLEEELNKIYDELKITTQKQVEEQKYDLELKLTDVNLENYHAIRKLAPFGVGNQKPVFKFQVIPTQIKQFGKTQEHLEITLPGGLRAISWYATPDSFTEKIEQGKQINLLAEFDYSVFRGREELRLKIVDVLQSPA